MILCVNSLLGDESANAMFTLAVIGSLLFFLLSYLKGLASRKNSPKIQEPLPTYSYPPSDEELEKRRQDQAELEAFIIEQRQKDEEFDQWYDDFKEENGRPPNLAECIIKGP